MSKSKIFLYLSFSFILGVLCFSFYNKLSLLFFGVWVCACLTIISVWWGVIKIRIVGFCGVFFILGALRLIMSLPVHDDPSKVYYYNDLDEKIVFQGIVNSEPDIRDDQVKLTVNSDSIQNKNELNKVSGRVLVSVPRFPEYSYGDVLKIGCKLLTPKEYEDFSYKDYLAKSDIYSVCYRPDVEIVEKDNGNVVVKSLLEVKDKFKSVLSRILPEPHASFLSGMVLGSKRGMPQELKDAFNATGTSHVVVISGLHITIVAGILIYISQILSIPKKYSFYFATTGLLSFILLTGAQPSSVRAGIMGGLVLLALFSGRLSDPKNAILCAASIMVLINPKVIRYDIGFQLSFLATIGIIYLSPYLKNVLGFIPDVFKFREIVAMTLSAQVLTLPVIIYNFERISLISPLANVLVVPLVPFIMTSGLFIGILGMFWVVIGKIFSFILWALLSYEMFVVNILNKVPFASIEVDKFWYGWVAIYYAAIFYVIWRLRQGDRLKLQTKVKNENQ